MRKRVVDALALAEIPSSKLGPARRSRLSDAEQALYFWILRQFRASGRPSRQKVGAQAQSLGLEFSQAMATFRREDLVHLGGDGEITVAYPFSGVPTAHRVRFPNRQEAFAMCAIDALGIAPMFDEPIEVTSRDPLSNKPFRVHVAPNGDASWQPHAAAVVCGATGRQADACCGCCTVLNFFASRENAKHWLDEHPQVHGDVIAIEEAIAAGRAIFGDVLRES